ncbi:cysteine-rich RLK (RECEPTOR-like protein kinase) 8 [Abeliophyllum distichum]|uniref:Cysteine-rich RLK (RECEPTOR-like protein kinase) 8 n=1 Tax=Abeliophyllum distichum TaxID=126358 RepID=A0ABD1URR1_9LAMI
MKQQQNEDQNVAAVGDALDGLHVLTVYDGEIDREALESVEPFSYEEAKKAMKEEINSLDKNDTWKLVERPKNQKVVHCKWIYKLKEGEEPNDLLRYKSRLVAKGFTQREGIDYNEVFFSMIKYKTISSQSQVRKKTNGAGLLAKADLGLIGA